ncbi:rhodanese-like domain-containing protein [Spirosoma sp. KCTC 42546]|uniref:rhodanese-like domain-containing protein n=1 Tax=Spirosoma sp. KCTC 42546 TaxID=2520506 RepID=UPI00115A7D11|nr:rhodanese-like domain-containing protein [Spirosoma sp. KCTC 42546]QDK81301.1 rhodanese-like domain-containing protein [Spirosoma sp. KCTC 42546]
MIHLLKSIFGSADTSNIEEVLAKGAIIIDVRSAGEFASGHAKGAVNIPLDQLESKLYKIKSYQKPLVLCCASGMRSARAKSFLADQGIADLHDAGSWRNLK